MRDILAIPFGFVLSLIYDFTNSYLLSLILLTLIVKLLLFPTAITQQKSTAKQVRLQPKVKRIQNTYAGNQQKIQTEMQALYQREGYSQTAGCLPLLIQLPIMLGLWRVMYTPLTHILKLPDTALKALKDAIVALGKEKATDQQIEIEILNKIKDGSLTEVKGVSAEIFDSIREFGDKFEFLGLDLSVTPKFGDFSNLLWLIPVLAGVTALMSSLYTMFKQKQNNPGMAGGASMGCMAFMSPVMSLAFTFMFPAGVGFYWIISNVLSFIQTVVLYNIYSPKKMIARQMVDETIRRRSYEENFKYISKTDEQ